MRERKTYAFIDAANIIYGTRDEGWKVDFERLFKYLKERYKCRRVYYFAGEFKKSPKQATFYKKLEEFGYDLVLKPVKIYTSGGKRVRKANCDVDLTFYAMRDIDKFDVVVFLSGDGDFEILLKHFVDLKKKVIIFTNARRTAREIKILKEIQFNDLLSLRGVLEFKIKKRR